MDQTDKVNAAFDKAFPGRVESQKRINKENEMKRTIVQIAVAACDDEGESLYALASDGSLWVRIVTFMRDEFNVAMEKDLPYPNSTTKRCDFYKTTWNSVEGLPDKAG